MTTCPLCGEPDHNGEPCYQKMRREWQAEILADLIAKQLGAVVSSALEGAFREIDASEFPLSKTGEG